MVVGHGERVSIQDHSMEVCGVVGAAPCGAYTLHGYDQQGQPVWPGYCQDALQAGQLAGLEFQV